MARRGNVIVLIRANSANSYGPLVPASWDVIAESNYWFSIYPLGRNARPDLFFHARLMVLDTGFTPARACYVCVAAPVVLQYLKDKIASDGLAWTKTWDNLQALRDDAGAAATAIKSAWRDDRPFDADGNRVGTLLLFYPRMMGYNDDDSEG